MEVTSRCPHARRTVFNGWELLRKYECEDCGAIATCLCDKLIAQYIVPHQAMAARDPESNQRVAVTDPLAESLCHACRGEQAPAFPRAAHRGTATVIHRYYWREIRKVVQEDFLAWCRQQGLPFLDGNGRPLISYHAKAHPAEYDTFQRSALDKYRQIHATAPLYGTTRESDVDLLARHSVPVEEARAWYVTPTQGRVLVTPEGSTQTQDALSPHGLKRILRYLAGDYWQRYLGWPDLLTWRSSPHGPSDLLFLEVKSSSAKLAEVQRSWIEGNAAHLNFPFRVVKVHRTGRLTAPQQRSLDSRWSPDQSMRPKGVAPSVFHDRQRPWSLLRTRSPYVR